MIRLAKAHYLNFVKPSHQWWLLATGAGLIALGVAGAVHELRHPPTEPAVPALARLHTHGPLAVSPDVVDAHRGDTTHDHSRVPGIAWLLLLPILLVFLVPPPTLGAFAAGRAGAEVPKPATVGNALPPAPDPLGLAVYDYAERAAWDDGRGLTGHVITLTGFVTPRPDGGWYLSRLRITCCAADARAYLIEVAGTSTDYPANTWVDVTGTYLAGDPGSHVARITALQVHTRSAPSESYEQ